MGLASKFNLNGDEKKIFEDYIANKMGDKLQPSKDEEFLDKWNAWIDESSTKGVAYVLNSYLIPKRPVEFKKPECVSVSIYESIAGKIPIIVVDDDDDFENLIINLAYRGVRPNNIHQQGASFLAGKTNRFIVLSKKPYSNIPASWMGLEEEDWRKKSMVLRRAHECTHYYTRRYYGTSQNNLHDELMADFFGLYAAFGKYQSKWFTHFMGVDGQNLDGRLSLYTKDLPKAVVDAIGQVAVCCSRFLENWSESDEFKNMKETQRVDFLCELGISGMFEKC